MPRSGISRTQVFETADALAREGRAPTVMAVRKRLGTGSPNTITPLLAEWKTLNEGAEATDLPPVPEPVQALARQLWGAAWRDAQGQLAAEREALSAARQALEGERADMLAEIARLDGELEAAREALREERTALEGARRAHDETKAAVREARAVADERAARLSVLESELAAERETRMALRVESASLTERAAQADELRALMKALQAGGAKS